MEKDSKQGLFKGAMEFAKTMHEIINNEINLEGKEKKNGQK